MTDTQTILIGGRSLTLREIEIADVERLRRMFHRLSADSVYRRFFSPVQEPSRSALLWLTNVDHLGRDALVALDGDEIVGVARYDTRAGAPAAEIAVTVEDAWQRRGLGRRLAVRLAKRAIARGIESFEATVQPDNRPSLGLLRKLSPDASVRFDHGSYSATMPLPQSAA